MSKRPVSARRFYNPSAVFQRRQARFAAHQAVEQDHSSTFIIPCGLWDQSASRELRVGTSATLACRADRNLHPNVWVSAWFVHQSPVQSAVVAWSRPRQKQRAASNQGRKTCVGECGCNLDFILASGRYSCISLCRSR
jgi:hypothetical protein